MANKRNKEDKREAEIEYWLVTSCGQCEFPWSRYDERMNLTEEDEPKTC